MNCYRKISNHRLLCENKKYSIYCHAGKLYVHKNNCLEKEMIIQLPMQRKKKAIVGFRFLERLFRLEPRFAYFISEDCILFSFQGAMYHYSIEREELKEEVRYRTGMNNPLMLCCNKNIEGKTRILFGEYWRNSKNEEVSIFERNIDGKWYKVYTFPSNTVYHIHYITYDSMRKCFWILTGDLNKESAIWKADLMFDTVTPLLQGKQVYRSCFIVPNENGLVYATDSPNENNYIFFIDLSKKRMEIKKLYEMPGPCIYGKVTNKGEMVIATSVEPDSSGLNKKLSLFSHKLGKGVKSKNSYIIYGSMEHGFKKVMELKKDIFMMGLFQFGNFYFPDYEISDRIKACPIALEKYDGKTLEIIIKRGKINE